MTLRILRTAALAALTLTALACNGDDGPTPTPSQSERTPTPSPSDETPTPRLTPAPAAKGWRTLAPMPTPRSEVAVAAVGGKIYGVGGFLGNGSPSDAVEVYDPVTDTWTQAPPLPEPRHHAAAASLFDKLFVFGGYRSSFRDEQATVFVFDPATQAWSEGAPMPEARGAHAVTVANLSIQVLYLVGGTTAGASAAGAFRYILANDSWERIADMPTARDHLGAGWVFSNHVYAIGGRVDVDFGRNLASNERYDRETQVWTERSPLPTPRSGVAVVGLGEIIDEFTAPTDARIYVFGGEGPEGTFDENEAYDPQTDTWETLEPMPTARHGLGAAVVGDTIYVIGGGETPGLAVSGANEAFTP